MPIYTTVCLNKECRCNNIIKERLVKVSKRNNIKCDECNNEVKRLIDLPAKMKEGWSGNWTEGLSHTAKYDVGLGTTVYSERHRDSLLKEKGWVRESDLGSDRIDRHINNIKEEVAKEDKFSKDYQENIKKFGGNKERALVETMPAKKILNDEI